MSYLLCHGFGFGDDYWRNLIPFLDEEYEFWHENFQPNPQKDYVGIGHSIGFLKLNNSRIKFRALVGLQGFLNFCGTDPIQKAARKKNIDRMMEPCLKNTHEFLQFFYKTCGYAGEIPENISPKDLIADLKRMKLSYPHCGVPTLIIGSHSDQIVDATILEDNFSANTSIQLKYIDNIPHNLGYLKAQQTFQMIKNFLEQVFDG